MRALQETKLERAELIQFDESPERASSSHRTIVSSPPQQLQHIQDLGSASSPDFVASTSVQRSSLDNLNQIDTARTSSTQKSSSTHNFDVLTASPGARFAVKSEAFGNPESRPISPTYAWKRNASLSVTDSDMRSVSDTSEMTPASSITSASGMNIRHSSSEIPSAKRPWTSPSINERVIFQASQARKGAERSRTLTPTFNFSATTGDNDGASILSSIESTGTRDSRRDRTPEESFVSRCFGDFLGNLKQLQPLHEKAFQQFGREGFVRNYRQLLRIHLLRLREQPGSRTRTESLTLRILNAGKNLIEIARNVVVVLEQEDVVQTKPLETLDFRPREQENVASWLTGLRSSESRELEAVRHYSRQASIGAEMKELENISTAREAGSDSGLEENELGGNVEESSLDILDPFEEELLSALTDAYAFLRRDLSSFELDLRLLLLPTSLRDILETVPKADISIARTNDVSFANKVKARIEDSTSLEWDWWPLRPRVHDLVQGRKRLEYKVCLPHRDSLNHRLSATNF